MSGIHDGDQPVGNARATHVDEINGKLEAEKGILQFFEYEHLPPHLAEISAWFGDTARRIVLTLPRNPERTVALRKLLEAKDAAVRARVAR